MTKSWFVRPLSILALLGALSFTVGCGKSTFHTDKSQPNRQTRTSDQKPGEAEKSSELPDLTDWDNLVDIEFPLDLSSPSSDEDTSKGTVAPKPPAVPPLVQPNAETPVISPSVPVATQLPALKEDEEDYTQLPKEFYIPVPPAGTVQKPETAPVKAEESTRTPTTPAPQKNPVPATPPLKPEPPPAQIPPVVNEQTPQQPQGSPLDPSVLDANSNELKPAKVKNQAIRYVDNGKLQNPSSLLERRKKYGEKSPFEVLFPSRGRFYATDDLADFIEMMGTYLQSLIPNGTLLLGDSSKASGGPIPSIDSKTGKIRKDKDGNNLLAHVSHQTGLDIDIAYFLNEQKSSFSNLEKIDLKKSVNLQAQFDFFLQATKSNMLDLIFVYPNLKKEFCVMAYKQGLLQKEKQDPWVVETLRRILPTPNHTGHFHLRLKCNPKIHAQCLERKDATLSSHGCLLRSEK